MDHRISKKAKSGEQTPSFSEAARATLTRQYLIVYAIVMGVYEFISSIIKDHVDVSDCYL